MRCVGFSASQSVGTFIPGINIFTLLVLNVEAFDVGGFYDNVTFRFTPPKGLYKMEGVVTSGVVSLRQGIRCGIAKNGVPIPPAKPYKIGNSRGLNFTNNIMIANISIVEEANGTDFYQLVAATTQPAGTIANASDQLTGFFCAALGLQCKC